MKPLSQFAQRLAADPEFAAKYERIVAELREQVRPEIEAIERSEQITEKDLAIVINARADNY